MDIASLDTSLAEEGATLEIRHPATGLVFEGMSIKVLGADSKVYRDAVKERLRSRLNDPKKKGVDIDKEEDRSIRLLAGMVVDWSGIEVDGEEVKPSRDNAVMLFTRFPWLREQVDEFVADRANFLPAA